MKWENMPFENLTKAINANSQYWSIRLMTEWLAENEKITIPESTVWYRVTQIGYLYSSVAPRTGKSFHLLSLSNMNGLTMKVYLEELGKAYPDKHIVLVWDNAPSHKLKSFEKIENLTIIRLPSYSPQLNPAERFFGEVRKGTANQIFETIDTQEEAITEKIVEYADDENKMKTLTGYEWIREQWERVF